MANTTFGVFRDWNDEVCRLVAAYRDLLSNPLNTSEPFCVRNGNTMKSNGLSFNSRKALTVNLGDSAGTEIANLIQRMANQIEELQRNKVSVTRIVPNQDLIDERMVG